MEKEQEKTVSLGKFLFSMAVNIFFYASLIFAGFSVGHVLKNRGSIVIGTRQENFDSTSLKGVSHCQDLAGNGCRLVLRPQELPLQEDRCFILNSGVITVYTKYGSTSQTIGLRTKYCFLRQGIKFFIPELEDLLPGD